MPLTPSLFFLSCAVQRPAHQSLEVRLHRALEEVSKQKEAVRQTQGQHKDVGQGQRLEMSRLEGRCQRLERQKVRTLSMACHHTLQHPTQTLRFRVASTRLGSKRIQLSQACRFSAQSALFVVVLLPSLLCIRCSKSRLMALLHDLSPVAGALFCFCSLSYYRPSRNSSSLSTSSSAKR